jgi:glyceraldehyde-3-phosphate dehydrogenase (NADP+)
MTQKHAYLIGREWREGVPTLPVRNPHTQEVIAEVCLAGTREILQAIDLASRAFEKTRFLPAYVRSRICTQIAEGIRRRGEEFARTIALESGKPLTLARAEAARGADTFSIAAEEAKRISGEVLNLDIAEHAHGKFGLVRRFPIGPIAGISPFNFPLNLVAHKVAPALACGCPIVLKPSSTTPLTALLLARVVLETEAVEGSLSVVPCRSADAAPLVEDPRLKLVTFTGSPATGWDIKRRAGKKRVVLELGGNAAVVIEPDADLPLAAQKICAGAFAFSGQVCISVQRVYVHESRFAEFSRLLEHETKKLNIGDPMDGNTDFGPMIDVENAERIKSWIDDAVRHGARIVTGGKRTGTLVEPTILTGVAENQPVVCKEAFAPVLVLEPYADFRTALRRVNDSDFGLQAGIFTNQMDKIMLAYNLLEVGGVVINDAPTFRVDNMPYGGVKDSGFGREGIRYALEEMTEMKILVLNNPVE